MLVQQRVWCNGRSPIDLPFGNPTWQWKISFFGGWNGTTSIHGGCSWRCSIAMFDCRRIYAMNTPSIFHEISPTKNPWNSHPISVLYASSPTLSEATCQHRRSVRRTAASGERPDGWEMLYHNGPGNWHLRIKMLPAMFSDISYQ